MHTRRHHQPQLSPLFALLVWSSASLIGCKTFALAKAQEIQVKSPNGRVAATVNAQAGTLNYKVAFKGQTVISPSALGVTVDGANLGQNAQLTQTNSRSFKETYPTRGMHNVATNAYNETTLSFNAGNTPWQLEVRAFDDGVAYRYHVAQQGTHKIGGEVSQWKLPTQSVVWYQTNTNEYENPFVEQQVGYLTEGAKIAAPVTAKLPNGLGYAVITEANLVGYSDMAFQVGPSGAFNAFFDKDAQGWNNQGDIVSPWRVTLLANDLTGLVNSDILTNLCPPPSPDLANASWIQTGRSNWHWLTTGRPQLSVQRQWVDWTKQLGFEYYLIDDGWVDWRADGKDQWACMKDIVDYAKTQNVKIWAWVHSREVRDDASRAAYFQKAKDIGLVGLKIDFPGRPNAEWVQWYDDTLRDLAKYQLMVDFHGAVKPSGRERTWPHELTRESIFGRESGKLPALHDTALPFTRYVQGPADFTPTDLRPARLDGGSLAHELAQAIVYTSPFLCYGGSPQNYLENPALDVLEAIPPTWDETLVLPQSEIGRTAAFARRKGDEWFVGVINGSDARSFPVNLSFLGKGNYRIEKLADSSMSNAVWNRSQGTVNRKTKFSADLRSNGGFVARITKVAGK